MGIGDFLKDVGHVAGEGIEAASSGLNVVDRYINPFHTEAGSAHADVPDRGNFLGLGKSPLGEVVVENGISPGIEYASRKLNWLYSNAISQPIATASLMAGRFGDFQDAGHYFSAAEWSKSWHAAEHVSAGQGLLAMMTLDESEMTDLVDSPLSYYGPGSAYLPPGFDQLPEEEQQKFLKQAGMPAVGNAYIEELRHSGSFFKYASGTADFALRWWGDPVILAGKGISAVRRTRQVVKRPAGEGWAAQDIDQIMDKSSMAKAQEFIWENRENPALLNNLQMTRNSALGPRFGAIAGLLKSPDEVHDFLRVTLGDTDAISRLADKNSLVSARIAQDTERLSALGLMTSNLEARGTGRSAQYAAMARQQMDALNARINADEPLVARYKQILEHANSMDEVNLSRWSFARAQDRTAAQAAYRASAARGAKAGIEGRPVTITPTPIFSRGTSSPVDLGFTKTRLFGVGDFFSMPVTVVRSFGNARPNGYTRIDDIDQATAAEVRGHIARIPGIGSQVRLNMLNDYLKTTTEGERLALLNQIGATGAAKVAEKHGLEPEVGLEIYKEHLKRQGLATDSMKRYSAAWKVRPNDEFPAGIRVDEFADDGGKLAVHPPTVTRLANDHVFQDLDQMDKVLARHSSALRAIRTAKLGNPDWLLDGADYLTSIFKFTTLFRLGYIPRVAGDDLAGQVARLGAVTMAARVGWGVRNGATNAALWLQRPMNVARAEATQQGADFLKTQMDELLTGTLAPLRDDIALSGVATSGKAAALKDAEEHHAWLAVQRTQAQKAADDLRASTEGWLQRSQSKRPVPLPGGAVAPSAFAGKEGEYYQKLVSSDDSMGQIFATNKQIIHGHLMRSFDHGGKVIRAADNEALHAQSWAHAINAQIMQDELSVLAVRGMSAEGMIKWLATSAEGRVYRQRLGLKVARDEDIANSAKHEVDEYMPTPEIRAAALEPTGVQPAFLMEHMPMVQRPELHTGQMGQATRKYVRALDGVMDHWYKFAASLPADRLSRHPLFNQLYEGHLKTLAGQLQKQGAYDTTVEGVERMATTARRLALRDTKKLVFDIAHRSDAVAALRFMSPFMAATTESFQRWARIGADKPQTVGYAANFYNAPLATGNMQDADGNDITRDGYSYSIDPKTGKAVKRLVPKRERYIVGRMPKSLIHATGGKLSPIALAFGMEPSSRNFKLSQNSMNLVTQGDPWFHPGVGPVVQIPVNAFVKDKPKAAELARHLSVLPFGPQNGGAFGSGPVGEAASFLLPSTIKNFLTAYDTSDERYQAVKMQIMQRAAFEHSELGKPMPSASKIAAMTKQYWMFSAASAFLQPMATQKADNYQLYRDQYNALRRIDPLTADDQFLERYGESYFIFAQSQSRNLSGIPATMKAVELSKKYGDLIAANPELGALIVGPEGNGPFSPEAYSYQLNTPVVPGGAEAGRTKMSATDAMKENQRRLGWSKYTGMVNRLTAELHNRGLKSFADKGAADLMAQKKAYTAMYAQPLLPSGEANPYYNAAWSEDFSTLDDLKYERLIPGLQAVARSPLADDPNRSDLRVLQSYLGARQAVLGILQTRAASGGKKSLSAKANSDLASSWQRFVDGLIESDTRFGDLHSRYLARDLGYDQDSQDEELAV